MNEFAGANPACAERCPNVLQLIEHIASLESGLEQLEISRNIAGEYEVARTFSDVEYAATKREETLDFISMTHTRGLLNDEEAEALTAKIEGAETDAVARTMGAIFTEIASKAELDMTNSLFERVAEHFLDKEEAEQILQKTDEELVGPRSQLDQIEAARKEKVEELNVERSAIAEREGIEITYDELGLIILPALDRDAAIEDIKEEIQSLKSKLTSLMEHCSIGPIVLKRTLRGRPKLYGCSSPVVVRR